MLKTNTIDSILKDFTGKIAQLKTIADKHQKDADFFDTSAQKLVEMQKEALSAKAGALEERARALTIASRIEALVG